jgi:hypothetical protein
MMDILDGFQKLVSTRRTFSISISIGLDCRDPQPYKLKKFIPLRAEQVSEANLRSEQGGINFTPFVLSLPNAKKKKKKKIKIFYMDGGQLKNVCLLSVVCLSFVCCLLSVVCHEFIPNYLLHRWSDWAKFFLTKTRENVYLRILILKFRGHRPRVKALG